MAFLNIALILVITILLQSSYAAPPVNLTEMGERDEEELKKLQRLKGLKQSDLTYTEDHNQFNFKVPKDAARVAFDVKGRSLPYREGRVLFRLNEGEYIKKLKDSKDHKWIMVQTLEKQPRRAWIPLSAVKLPPERNRASEDESLIK